MPQLIAKRYHLGREIGRGGMGAVYLGHDTVLDRAVALKQVGLLPGSDRADVDRVRREARVSAMLQHANVVGVFDLVSDGGKHWLVMEYVDSATLADRIRRRRLTPDELAPILAQVAEALAAAHDAGIVHRDVKPSNILIGHDGVVKLGDFGIARTISDATLTMTGMVTGSPGYLAPEVATGRPANSASDMWSFGATIYHCLEGKPPYEGGDNLMASLYRLVHEEPPRSDRAGWLDPLLRATMHRDPHGRWTAAQVAAYLSNGPTAVLPAMPQEGIPGASPPAAPAPPPTDQPTELLPGLGPATPPRRWPIVALVAILLMALTVGAWLLARDDGGNDATPSAGDRPTSSAPTSSPTTEAPRPTKAGMEGFIRNYLRTVAADPAVAWTRLTKRFQDASGGYQSYIGWWGGLEKAEVTSISANPDDLTVSYEVSYDWEKKKGKGKLRRDDPTLELTFDGGTYLIDYERN